MTSAGLSAQSPDRTDEASAAPGALPAGIECRGVGAGFGRLEVIERLDLLVAPGEIVGLVGPSGCGKSTLLELVCGLLETSRGEIEVAGRRSARDRLEACALMPQRDLLLPWSSALDNAAVALRNRGVARADARQRAAGLLARFGLEGFERSRPAELSGGMRQRVAFARTILADKPVLLLDEPFGALDVITRAEMQEWLAAEFASPASPARTVLLVTHDVEEVLYLCDRVVVLSARPARPLARLRSPRPRALPRAEALADPELARARAQATELLTASSIG